MGNVLDQDDFVAAGFHRVDAWVVRPAKIKWGKLYQSKSPTEKLLYLERFACTMNEASARLQHERNQLAELCEKKERQLESMSHAVGQNNAMLQSEVTRLNEDRQAMLVEIARLKAEARA
jgi:hypothetical protein